MQLQVLKTPGSVNLSGMPMLYVFSLLGYGAAERAREVKINVSVFIEDPYNSNIYTEAKQQAFFPDKNGNVTMDVKGIADAYLEFFIPPVDLQKTVICLENTTRVKIKYQLNDNGSLGNTLECDPVIVIKGGVNDQIWTRDVFTDITNSSKRPLNLQETEPISPSAAKFLFWVNPNGLIGSTLQIKFTGILDDQSQITNTFGFTVENRKMNIYCTPIGLKESGLQIPEGRTPLTYQVEIINYDGTNLIDPILFQVDYRSFYQDKLLYYINSLGAMEMVRILGEIDYSSDYESVTANKAEDHNVFVKSGILSEISSLQDNTESWSFSGNTGYINRQTVENLRGLLLSKHRFILESGILIPIMMDTKSVKFYTNKDNLYNLQVDWTYGRAQRFYTDRLPQPVGICPAVEQLYVSQLDKNNLQLSWSIPAPHSQLQMSLTIGDIQQDLTLMGNVGSKVIAIDVGENSEATIRARVACNPFTNPESLGPLLEMTTPISAVSNPIAPDINISGISFGQIDESGSATLEDLHKNVLDYAYNPDGVDIELVNPILTNTDTPGGKGKYQIHADGSLHYASKTGALGLDYFPYQVKNTVGNGSAAGMVKITLGGGGDDGEGTTVYVNTRYISSGGSASNFIAFFYKDAAMSIPYDVSGKGLILKCLETLESDSKRSGPNESNTSHDIEATGTNMVVGVADGYSYYGPDDDWEWWERSWKVLPDAAYTIV